MRSRFFLRSIPWVLTIGLGFTGCKKPGEPPVVAPAADAGEPDFAEPPGEFSPDAGDFQLTVEDPKTPKKRPQPKPVNARDDAFAALAKGNPEGARDFLSQWLSSHPDDHPARLAAAHAYLRVGDVNAAQQVLQAGDKQRGASAKNSAKVARLRLLARIARLRGDIKTTEGHLQAALKLVPDDAATRGELLELWMYTGRRESPEARKLMDGLYDTYEAGKATDIGSLMAVARAGIARGSSGAYQDANMVLGEAEQLADPPGDPLAFTVRDDLLLLRGSMFAEKYAENEALETYQLILQRDPWHPDALAGQASTQLRAFALAAAWRSAEMVLQTNPEHPRAHAVMARVELVEGKFAAAKTRVEQHVLAQNPNDLEGLAVAAALALRADDKSGYATIRDTAVAYAADGGDFLTTLGELLVSLHMYPEAGEIFAKAVELAPKNPLAQSAYGLNLLRLGDEKAGREALEAAWKRDRFNERTLNTLELYREQIDPNYTDISATKLSLRLPTLDHEWLADDLVAAYARARKALDKRYGIDPGLLRLEAFATPEAFSVRTLGVPSFGALGVCFGKVITLVGNHGGTHNLHQVIWHELAHVYAIRLSRGRVPRWFTEGLSEWESELADPSWARESAELLASARRQGKMRRLDELELAFLRAESPAMMEVAYATASYAMRYLGQTYGIDRIKAVLKGYGAGKTTEELVLLHFGKDLKTLADDFDTWMVGQLNAKVTGWHPKGSKGRGGKAATDPRETLLKQAVKQAQAKDYEGASRTLQKLIGERGDGYHARMLLGEVLLQGPSWKSAKQHFEHAHKFHSEAIEPLSKLAQVARRSGDVAGEKAVLTTALKIDGMSFDPAARLVMLAVVSNDAGTRDAALTRAVAIAPLHPISLAGRALALADSKRDKKRAEGLLQRAVQGVGKMQGAGLDDSLLVVALACEALGRRDQAIMLAAKIRAEAKLVAPARAAVERLQKLK